MAKPGSRGLGKNLMDSACLRHFQEVYHAAFSWEMAKIAHGLIRRIRFRADRHARTGDGLIILGKPTARRRRTTLGMWYTCFGVYMGCVQYATP